MPTFTLNLWIAWAAVLMGVISGAALGLRFHGADWLGGYASWPRRMLRLGHIAWFGIGFLNFALFLTARSVELSPPAAVASPLLAAANVLMPAACYLTAWRPRVTFLFALPVGCVAAAAALVLFGGLS